MFRFQIHEDHENAALDRRGNLKRNNDLKNVRGKENLAAEEKSSRRVMQHVTDAKLNSILSNRVRPFHRYLHFTTIFFKTLITKNQPINNILLSRSISIRFS